eukprot:2670051-Amphidinium_carterae.1
MLLYRLKRDAPFGLKSGQRLDRQCLWMPWLRRDADTPHQKAWKGSVDVPCHLGLAAVYMLSGEWRTQMTGVDEIDETDDVLALVTSDTYFPFSEYGDVVSTLPKGKLTLLLACSRAILVTLISPKSCTKPTGTQEQGRNCCLLLPHND